MSNALILALHPIKRARIQLKGTDLLPFLERLLTASVKSLAPGQGTRAFLLDARGRVRVGLRLFAVSPVELLAECAEGYGEALIEALAFYQFTEDVVFESLGELCALGIHGAQAASSLSALGLSPPQRPLSHSVIVWEGEPVRLLNVPRTAWPGFELWASARQVAELTARLMALGAISLCDADLNALRVDAGLPEHPFELSADSTPLEVGALDGLTQGKGCYPGQEVIERTLALGRPARKLVHLTFSEGAPCEDDRVLLLNGEPVGTLTSLAPKPDGTAIALALVKGSLRLGANDRLQVGGREAALRAGV